MSTAQEAQSRPAVAPGQWIAAERPAEHGKPPARGREERRAELAAERTSQILDAAVTVFARKGYQRATTKEIAAAAGVAEGTIYNYYSSKRELLMAMIKRLAADTLPPIFAQAPADPREAVAAIVHDRLQLVEHSRPILQVVFQELAVDEELRREFFHQVILPAAGQAADFYQRCVGAGLFRPLDLRVAFPAMVGSIAMTLLLNAAAPELGQQLPGRPLSREVVVQELIDFLLHGLTGKTQAEDQRRGDTK